MTMNTLRWIHGLFALPLLVVLGGCGALTGLPGHGGGKRFAVEQELVAAATRGAIKQIDLSAIRGKKINLFVNAIGDTGAGNLVGGRFSVASQLRGDYIQAPPTKESSTFPRYTSSTSSTSSTSGASDTSTGSTSTSTSNHSTTVSESTTDSVLPMADSKKTQQKGHGGVGQFGAEYKGIGAYQNSEEITSNDLQYLTGLLQTYLFLRGVNVVPPSEADIDVYVTIDVFGTVRSRVEWFIANNEILRAKTALEVLAVDHLTGQLVMPPQSAGAEAEYNEQYIFWAGPVMIKQTLQKTKPLLSDFTDFTEIEGATKAAEQDVTIPYPFKLQMEKMRAKKDEGEVAQ
ncbi:MAG: hypothetical protein OEL83_13480 [Desulforhopalus sp.]|nr:hypothetical protein [Desulforhopalus sp.]